MSEKHPSSEPTFLRRLFRELQPVLLMLIVLLSFRSAIADWNHVPSGSMKPNIVEGDRIAVNKLAYGLKLPFTRWTVLEWAKPKRGEVIVFWSPADEKRYVKRVIGLPGDTIEVQGQRLLVNGQQADYQELAHRGIQVMRESLQGKGWPIGLSDPQPAAGAFGPVEVPDGGLFVMGDHRDRSLDSREFGFVESERVIGRAIAVAISLDASQWYRPRWERFLLPLD